MLRPRVALVVVLLLVASSCGEGTGVTTTNAGGVTLSMPPSLEELLSPGTTFPVFDKPQFRFECAELIDDPSTCDVFHFVRDTRCAICPEDYRLTFDFRVENPFAAMTEEQAGDLNRLLSREDIDVIIDPHFITQYSEHTGMTAEQASNVNRVLSQADVGGNYDPNLVRSSLDDIPNLKLPKIWIPKFRCRRVWRVPVCG